MLSLEDCIAFSGLTGDQLDAVACFKHIPPIVAAEWAETVLDRPLGCREIEQVLAAEVRHACSHHLASAVLWGRGLDQFHREHAFS